MIFNAKDRNLNENSGTVPDVSGALQGWYQQMTFSRVVKTIENFQVVETKTDTTFMGTWNILSGEQLQMKPEGQRAWKWYQVNAEIALVLAPDEVVTYLGTQYRVKDVSDYRLHGYMSYHLVEDYTGSGPE